MISGSPAIDASPGDSDCQPTDQRGVTRSQGVACDIGAFELSTDDNDGDNDGFPVAQGDCDDTNPAIHPGATERCNSVDDDCDTGVDEGFVLGMACTVGQGACQASGITVCTLDGSTTECSATPGTPSPAVCNGSDDDCDSEVDEASPMQPLFQPCYPGPSGTQDIGVCHGGTQACLGGSFSGPCQGEVTPTTENCTDGLDNDCDGQTDFTDPTCQVCGNGHLDPGEQCDGQHQQQRRLPEYLYAGKLRRQLRAERRGAM